MFSRLSGSLTAKLNLFTLNTGEAFIPDISVLLFWEVYSSYKSLITYKIFGPVVESGHNEVSNITWTRFESARIYNDLKSLHISVVTYCLKRDSTSWDICWWNWVYRATRQIVFTQLCLLSFHLLYSWLIFNFNWFSCLKRRRFFIFNRLCWRLSLN